MGRTAPGWYPDPSAAGTQRWFDGDRWSQHTRPAAVPASTQRLPLGVGTLGGDPPRTPPAEGEETPFAAVRPGAEEQPGSYAPAATVRAQPPVPRPPSGPGWPGGQAGGTGTASHGPTASPSSARRSPAQRGRLSGPSLWVGCAVLVLALAGSGIALAGKRSQDGPPVASASKTASAPSPVVDPPEDRTPDYVEVANSAVLDVASLKVDAVVAAAPSQSALATVALLEVGDRDGTRRFAVEAFGKRFADTDGNGCDTRNDALGRSLSGVSFKPGTDDCVVVTGLLADPYGGTDIAFERGPLSSGKVQLDHVVALTDAWHKGAWSWDRTRREAFANDPLNLLVVDGALNQQKGDGDASAWLPPDESYRCAYVARQVGVKYTYGLRVTGAEKTAMVAVLSACPDEPLPAGSTSPPPRDPVVPPVDRPRPTPTPTPEAPSVDEPSPSPSPSPDPTPVPRPTPRPTPQPTATPAPEEPTPTPTPIPADCRVKGLHVRQADGATNLYYLREDRWIFKRIEGDVCFEDWEEAEEAGFSRAWW